MEKVTKMYKDKVERRKETGVANVDLTIEQGEFVFVVGSSGSGKSTLLGLMTGYLKPDRGRVCLDGRDLQWLMPWSKNRATALFGQVWQEDTLMRKRTVEENLLLAARIRDVRWKNKHEAHERVDKVLALVGMTGMEKRYPVELSGGECKRVELARALINSPPILVLDEITANLDDDTLWDILQLLQEINHHGTTVVMATHASQYVNILRRRVITLKEGRIIGDVKKGKYGDIV
jgi:cell division transport system ATP-binding protein